MIWLLFEWKEMLKKIDVALAFALLCFKKIQWKETSKFLKNGSEKNVVQVQFRRTRNHVKLKAPTSWG